MELRRITPEDAQAAHAVTMAGFRTYPAFAPEGWQPPADMGAEGATKRLARDGSYGVVAVDVDAIVGFAAYEPAREETDEGFAGPLIPGLAHVWAVFVAEPHWGRGVATRAARRSDRPHPHGRLRPRAPLRRRGADQGASVLRARGLA